MDYYDYLTSLRKRTQTRLKTARIQSHLTWNVGDIVLIKDKVHRWSWRLGKVLELVTSSDGHAKFQLSTGNIVGWPLCLLYPIETSGTQSKHLASTRLPTLEVHTQPETVRRSRRAAKCAQEQIKNYMNRKNVR